jgi:hypothetical protein
MKKKTKILLGCGVLSVVIPTLLVVIVGITVLVFLNGLEFGETATTDPEVFVASIPGVVAGESVEYYLSAADRSGRRETLPRTAPDGVFSCVVTLP